MKAAKIVLTLVMLANCAVSNAADWTRYTTQNFTLYSDSSEKKVESLLHDFEIFRTVALAQLGLPVDQPENQRLVILMFNSTRDYRQVGAPSNSAGFYLNDPVGPRMVIAPSSDRDFRREVLFHEYVHYLFFQHSTFNYPRWYMEGMADVLSTADITSSNVMVGSMAQSRRAILSELGRIRVNQLLDLRSRNDNSVNFEARFYATAWVMTHYLQISSIFGDSNLSRKTSEYLRRYNEGEDSKEAFEAAFGMTTLEMDNTLEAYIRARKIPGATWPLPQVDQTMEKTRINPSEKAHILAALAINLGQEDAALAYLAEAAETDSYTSRLQAMEAVILNHKTDATSIATGRELANQALLTGKEDSATLSDLAHFEMDVFIRSQENNSATTEQPVKAEQLAEQALALDPTNLIAYRFLADAQIAQGRTNDALRTLIEAHNNFRGFPYFPSQITKVLIRNQRPDLARPFVMDLVSAAHSPEVRELLLTLLDQIDSGEVDPALVEKL